MTAAPGDRPGRELPRGYRDLVHAVLAADAGWTYRRHNGRGRGKPRLLGPDGRVVALPNTPSCHRGLANTRAHLRRAGVNV